MLTWYEFDPKLFGGLLVCGTGEPDKCHLLVFRRKYLADPDSSTSESDIATSLTIYRTMRLDLGAVIRSAENIDVHSTNVIEL